MAKNSTIAGLVKLRRKKASIKKGLSLSTDSGFSNVYMFPPIKDNNRED
jgi:hypothetical protein